MSCEEIREDLVARLDGELDPTAAARVDRHVEGCRECAEEVVALRAIAREVGLALSRAPQFDTEQALQGLLAALQKDGPDAHAAHAAHAAMDRRQGGALRLLRGGRERQGLRGGASFRTDAARRGPPLRPGRAGWASRWVAAGGLAAVLAIAVAVGVNELGRERGSSIVSAGSGRTSPAASREARTARAPAAITEDRKPAQGAIARGPESSRSGGPVLATADQAHDGDDDLQVPDEVRRQPGMFLDIPIVQRLDKLRNLEAVYYQTDEGSG